jgi:hypothetical protein
MNKKFYNIGNGVLWKNKYKKKEKEPFFLGKATIKGNEIDMAGWIKNDKNGKEVISISFNDNEEEKGGYKVPKNKNKSLESIFGGSPKGETWR